MELTIYKNFNKRKNSTKLPTGGETIQVLMKRGTSIDSPVFLIDGVDLSVNYCKFNNRYYFVTDITLSNNNIYEVSCQTDYLATYKTQILATSANVLYASSSTRSDIVDSRIPVTHDSIVRVSNEAINGWIVSGITNQGAVVLGITGKGSFGAYLMQDSTQIHELIDGIDDFSAQTLLTTDDILKQMFYGGNACDCLKSAIALPLVIGGGDVTGEGAEDLYLGGYPCKSGDSAIQGYHITKPILKSTTTILIPWLYNDWRKSSPYSEVILYLPFIGTIPLPTNDMQRDLSINVTYSLNVTSGDLSVEYVGSSGHIIGTASTNIAMATAFGSTGIDTNKLTNAVAAGAGALVSAGAAALSGGLSIPTALGVAGGLATAAGQTISSLGGNGNGSGGLGGGASQGLDPVIHCYVISRELANEPGTYNDVMGKPYMGVTALSQFSGFVMTEGFSLNAAGFENDKQAVNSMMDAGIYIE